MKSLSISIPLILFAFCILLFLPACSKKNAELEAEIARVEKLAQRALDVQEVQNVWSRHASYDAAGMNREQIKDIWAQNQPDVAFIQNTEMRIGLDNIIAYYCDMWDETRKARLQAIRKLFPEIPDDEKYALAGWMKMHTNTTPNIQIAGDGQTAKGSWESPGFITELAGDNFMAAWIWERYFVDFIKEDGKWKIWHANLLVQFMTPFEKSWVESSMEQVKGSASGAPGAGGSMGGMPTGAAAAKTELRSRLFAVNKLCGPLSENFPKQPEPYYTFSETFSYGPDMLEQEAAKK
ncbi:MAG: nuclear transport factor 2 family protein [Deltaproteobacteria bacterium]|nr:nuclear transport factor 2 family protein [Deltaproteobacteria bacterium]